jgi:hypothetical protein
LNVKLGLQLHKIIWGDKRGVWQYLIYYA